MVIKLSRLQILAGGGSSSAIGRVVLEYCLFPKTLEMPHIVVWSHAANDSHQDDLNPVYYKSLPSYISAARNLRSCDVPIVVMSDYSHGNSGTAIVTK